MNQSVVDTLALQRALIQAHKDWHRKLSLTAFFKLVQTDTDIGTTTLGRISKNVGVPDTDTIVKLAHWLEIPVERFIKATDNKAISYLPSEPTPSVVDALLFKDKSLTQEAAAYISDIFRRAYELAPKKENGRGDKKDSR